MTPLSARLPPPAPGAAWPAVVAALDGLTRARHGASTASQRARVLLVPYLQAALPLVRTGCRYGDGTAYPPYAELADLLSWLVRELEGELLPPAALPRVRVAVRRWLLRGWESVAASQLLLLCLELQGVPREWVDAWDFTAPR